MAKQMLAYQFRAMPTKRQERELGAILDRTRELYNAALQERRDAYKKACADSEKLPPEKKKGAAYFVKKCQKCKGAGWFFTTNKRDSEIAVWERNENGNAVQTAKHGFYCRVCGGAGYFTGAKNLPKELKQDLPGKKEQNGYLTGIRADLPELSKFSQRPCRGVIMRLDLAFQSFFRRVKAGQKPGYPRFRGKGRWDSIDLLENGFTWRAGNRFGGADEPEDGWKTRDKVGRFAFKGVSGGIRIWQHRAVLGKIKTAQMKRTHKGWTVNIVCETERAAGLTDKQLFAVAADWKEQIERDETPDGIVGIDVGLESFLTDNAGKAVANPRLLKGALRALRRSQRALARKQKGGKNREKARRTVSRLHAKVRNTRKNFHYETAAALLKQAKYIGAEELNIAGLAKNKRLSRQIYDVGWAAFINRLSYKAECAGGEVVKVSAKGTSQKCSNPACGAVVKKELRERRHNCPQCGLSLHRDHNAGRNIVYEAVNRLLGANPEVSPG